MSVRIIEKFSITQNLSMASPINNLTLTSRKTFLVDNNI